MAMNYDLKVCGEVVGETICSLCISKFWSSFLKTFFQIFHLKLEVPCFRAN